ncbi:flagellar basal body rod protein FlgC [Ampullimonas aquatilis]|uniref:flagellar basal body rod protein FlgC n=1 Tax=Ampullimonas aquatilis TaxID=1341549 RepID=UPI003C795037
MSLFKAFEIASTGVSAQSMRLNVVASNMANAESVAGPDGQTYQARHVVFQAMAGKQAAGQSANSAPATVGVKQVVTDTTPGRKLYDPKHPMADQDGYITMPNINPVEEMVNMISASRSYQSNIEVMNTAKTLMQKTLSLGQ